MKSSNSATRGLDNRNVDSKNVDVKNAGWKDISTLDTPLVIAIFAILAICFFVAKAMSLG